MTRIDLNADLGEDESPEGIARDLAIMEVITSCNIACGGHAGSAANMKIMINAAAERNVAAGAHPSYPDRANFGRKSMNISINDLKDSIKQQFETIRNIAYENGQSLHHIKPHGALYNDAQDDPVLAKLFVNLALGEELPLVGMTGSFMQNMASQCHLEFISEAFIDRRYNDQGRLVSRSKVGAVLTDDNDRLHQGFALATAENIRTETGNSITITADTLCLHADSEGSLNTARQMRKMLENAGIIVATPESS